MEVAAVQDGLSNCATVGRDVGDACGKVNGFIGAVAPGPIPTRPPSVSPAQSLRQRAIVQEGTSNYMANALLNEGDMWAVQDCSPKSAVGPLSDLQEDVVQ